MTDLMVFLPELYRDIKEFVELTQTEDAELASLSLAIQRVLDDQFITTSTERAVKRREKPLGIQADPTLETLEFRRKRLINRYSTRPPFTVRYLQQRLDALLGPGMAEVSVDAQNFVLTVTIGIPDAAYFKEIIRTIDIVKPANLEYKQQTAIMDGIVLEEHIWAMPLIRKTKLGSWQLGTTPFAMEGQEVQIK
ncbi:putative phage tail protein [Paenibacillus sp. GCM10027626]|uniref:putative phage tail protein n=1 Tax=Paenibacillus sp. GCM10027626 TaxID=3273411 RepID=UPI003635006A